MSRVGASAKCRWGANKTEQPVREATVRTESKLWPGAGCAPCDGENGTEAVVSYGTISGNRTVHNGTPSVTSKEWVTAIAHAAALLVAPVVCPFD